MLLVIDNYDSFTYNLVQYLSVLTDNIEVHRNDAISVDQAAGMTPDAIVLSPGPCTPAEAGNLGGSDPATGANDPNAGRLPGDTRRLERRLAERSSARRS